MDDIYERAEAELDQAAVRFTNEKAKLFRGDGAAIYADAVYEEKVTALTAELHAVAEAAHNVGDTEIAAVQRQLEAEHDDPITRLTPQEQQAASACAVFVREDAALLSLPDLTQRLRGVAAGGKDRVSAYLWSRYARQRIAAITTANADGAHPINATTRGQLETLTDAISELEAVIGVANPLTEAQAARRVAAARKFQAAIRDRVGELDGSKEQLLRATKARYGGF